MDNKTPKLQLYVVRDLRKHKIFIVDQKFIRDGYVKNLGPWTYAVYSVIATYADKNGEAFPGQSTIASFLGISRETVNLCVKKLRFTGIINIDKERTEKGKFLRNVYTLLDREEWKPCERSFTRSSMLSRAHKSNHHSISVNTNVLTERGVEKKKETDPWTPAELIAYIQEMRANKLLGIRIIGNFLLTKGISIKNFQTKKQVQFEIKRNLRAANRLIAFPEDRISQVMAFLREHAKFTWTLETVEKYITVENLSPEMLPGNRKQSWQK